MAHQDVVDDRRALYRLCDEEGTLLYVGTTNNIKARWRQHAKDKPWWPQVDYGDYLWFPSRAEAEAKEQLTIARECPPFNRQMPPWYLPVPTAQLNAWKDSFNRIAELAFEVLTGGGDLATVAEAANWSPQYIVKLGQQRHVPWALEYAASRQAADATEES